MDTFHTDSHKLAYHVDRVNAWLHGADIYPLYMEVSPSGACNHRCRFCGKDFMEYQHRFLDWAVFQARIEELGRLGIKSMMHAGEGEPLLHENLPEMVQHGQACGIDQAITTNGVLLTPERAEAILPNVEWLRVSLDAGTPETYADLHGTRPGDFTRVIENLAEANRIRRAKGLRCTLGVQMLLLPENRGEVATLARLARDIGMNYLMVKPYSQHPLSRTTRYKDVRYEEDLALAGALTAWNTEDFQVIFRARAMQKWNRAEHAYPRCLALPFWCYLDAGGNVWACSMYLRDERFWYGNINESTFQKIWEGERRHRHLEWVRTEMDAQQCRVNCRMDEVNRYLWELQNPPAHVNFI